MSVVSVSSAPAEVAVAPGTGRIGPNAIIRVAEVLPARIGEAATAALFARAGLSQYLRELPVSMVDEAQVQRLHEALRRELGEALAREVAREAGVRTAAYLLAHRIPRPVQWLLMILPPAAAARLLLSAISRHAWTFAGSGDFAARAGRPIVLTIRNNPMCAGLQADAPACAFYAATFEALFSALVHPRARVVETACEALGAPECVFEVRW
jgi:divinyl protochlorophyllide a 8-vinyl-reductase